MKWIALCFTLVCLIPTSFTNAQQLEVPAPVSKIYVPTGFDDNDDVQVFVYGNFPNSCFQLGSIHINRDESARRFVIDIKATYLPDAGFCVQILKPYVTAIKLGTLPQGVYQLVVNPEVGDIRRTISIGKSVSGSTDDFFYADVVFADIEDGSGGSQLLVIEGFYPILKRGCARFAEDPRVIDDAYDLITVLPILEFFDDHHCNDGVMQFRTKILLERAIEGETLIHVRRIGGMSYTRLFLE